MCVWSSIRYRQSTASIQRRTFRSERHHLSFAKLPACVPILLDRACSANPQSCPSGIMCATLCSWAEEEQARGKVLPSHSPYERARLSHHQSIWNSENERWNQNRFCTRPPTWKGQIFSLLVLLLANTPGAYYLYPVENKLDLVQKLFWYQHSCLQ